MNAARDVKRNTLKCVLIANKLNRRKNKMTDEQVKNNPWMALKYFADKLTEEQKKYCKEITK